MMTGPQAVEQLQFNSDTLPAAERFPRYRELYAAGANATQTGPDFRARVHAWRLDRAVLYERHLHHVGHDRPAARLATDGFSHWTLTLLVAGVLEVDAGFGFTRVRPGEVMLIDTTRPGRNRMEDAHILTMSVARERIQPVAGDLDGLHGVVVPAEQAGLLADYLQSLSRRLSRVPPACIPAATQPIATLLAITLASDGEAMLLPGHAERVRQLIEAQLSDPDFTVPAVIEQSGLSRATLYRLFQAQGGLALYIQRRRLNRVRVALADLSDTRPFAEIAHAAGFGSESHCSRLFFDAYGLRPRDFRVAATRADVAVAGQMEYLQDEVR